jgi:DNA invertase Pin-like site-specific DNA recombinase
LYPRLTAGVALVMCDRKILSSDRGDRDQLVDESAAAEKYSRRLSERITDGFAAKFEQRRDPGGHPPFGFRRLPEPPHTLEVDPATIPTAVGLFERYALGTISSAQLAT